ncbi:MAG: nucleotidyltransferase domain-containing protein [Cuniculiplasma divulgatum]|jgi:predicted nucleotidyltransferase
MSISQDYELTRLSKLRNYQEVLKQLKILVRGIDPEARIIFFGSVLRGDYTASSDIDIIVIPSDMAFKDKITLAVWRSLDAPVELHIITKEQFDEWYLRFIDMYKEI